MELLIGRTRFGHRLRRLRQERGWTLHRLAGPGLSVSQLSRLENGARNPTEPAIRYLADRLGVTMEELLMDSQPALHHALGIVAAADHLPADERAAYLKAALDADNGSDDVLGCHALWLLAGLYKVAGSRPEQIEALRALVELADRAGEVDLRIRSRAQLARLLREAAGKDAMEEAATLAQASLEIARAFPVQPQVETEALMATLSVSAEAGQLGNSQSSGDEQIQRLLHLADQLPPRPRTEALWTVAAVQLYQGHDDLALTTLEQALVTITSAEDLLMWARLRLAAVRLCLAATPPRLDQAAEHLRHAEPAIELLGNPEQAAAHAAQRAQLALLCGRFEDANEIATAIGEDAQFLAPRDRARHEETTAQIQQALRPAIIG